MKFINNEVPQLKDEKRYILAALSNALSLSMEYIVVITALYGGKKEVWEAYHGKDIMRSTVQSIRFFGYLLAL
jgi:hypothetical protein